MKEYIKNGLTYNITDALYQKLMEAGENNNQPANNPQTNQPNPQGNSKEQNYQEFLKGGETTFFPSSGNGQKNEFNKIRKEIANNLKKNLPKMEYIKRLIKNEENITGNKIDYNEKYKMIAKKVMTLAYDCYNSGKFVGFDMDKIYSSIRMYMLSSQYLDGTDDWVAIKRSNTPKKVATRFINEILWALSDGKIGEKYNGTDDNISRDSLQDFVTYIQIFVIDEKGSPTGNIIDNNFIVPDNYKYWFKLIKNRNCLKMDLSKVKVDKNLIKTTHDTGEEYTKSYKEKNEKFEQDYYQEINDIKYITENDDNLKQTIKELISNYSSQNPDNTGKYNVQFFTDETCNDLINEMEVDINSLKDTSLKPINFNNIINFGYNKELQSIDSSLRKLIESDYISAKASFEDVYNELSEKINENILKFSNLFKLRSLKNINYSDFINKVKKLKKTLIKKNYTIKDAIEIIKTLYNGDKSSEYKNKLDEIDFVRYSQAVDFFYEYKQSFMNYSQKIEKELNNIMKENSYNLSSNNTDFSFNDERFNTEEDDNGLYNLQNTKGKGNNVINDYLNFLKAFFGADTKITEEVNEKEIKNGYYINSMLRMTYKVLNLILVSKWENLSIDEKKEIAKKHSSNSKGTGLSEFIQIMGRDPENKDIELYDRASNQLSVAKSLVSRIKESLSEVLSQKGILTEPFVKEFMWRKMSFSNKFNLVNWANGDDNMKNKVMKLGAIQNSFLKSALAYAYLTENENKLSGISKEIVSRNESNKITFDRIGDVLLNLDIVTNISPTLFYQSLVESEYFANEFRIVEPLITSEGNQTVIYLPIAKQSGNVFCLIRIKKLFGLWG